MIFGVEKRKLLSAFLLAFLLLMGTYNTIFTLMAFAICLYYIAASKETFTACMLIFIMPFAGIFKYSADGQSFYTYLLLIFVLFYIIRNARVARDVLYIAVYACALFIIQLLNDSVNVERSIKFIANLLFVFFVVKNVFKEKVSDIFILYVLGVVLSSMVTLCDGSVFNISEYIAEKKVSTMYGFGNVLRFSGLYADPNYYSINAIISLCLLVLLDYSKKINSLSAIVILVALISFVILSRSKSALLMMALPAFLYVYSNYKRRQRVKQVFTIIGILVIIVAAFSGRISALDIVLTRLQDADNINELTTGRVSLWLMYLKYFGNLPLSIFYGNGLGYPLLDGHGAHNTYIDIIYYIGILGGVACFAIIKRIFGLTQVYIKRNLLNFSILICIGIMYFFLSELFYYDPPVHICLAILVYNMDFDVYSNYSKISQHKTCQYYMPSECRLKRGSSYGS
jgi:O-antigen ligase